MTLQHRFNSAHDRARKAHGSEIGRLPEFLIVGATKCGTTSLHAYLGAHDQVFMHPHKELRYFTAEHNFRRGPDWYRAQFAAARHGQIAGEASNAYTRDPVYGGVPARIAALLPNVKLVYLVREPWKRLESHWRHRLVTGWEARNADKALRVDPSYVSAGLYGHQIAALRRHVAQDRILVLQSEALFADPDPQLRKLAAFLGIDHDTTLPFSAENVTAPRRQAPAALRQLSRLGPTARDGVRRMVARLGPRSSGGKSASAARYAISPGLTAEIGATLAADRALLVDLVGPDIVDGWPAPEPACAPDTHPRGPLETHT